MTLALVTGNAARLALAEGTVHCVVTSPPFWGLRDYGLPPSIWPPVTYVPMPGLESMTEPAGCDFETWRTCEHEWGDLIPGSNRGGSGTPTNKNNRGEGYARVDLRGQWCQVCGCWRGCLGLEPTPELYTAHLVLVFRDVWRVLREDGVTWLNIGDSFASGKGTCHNPGDGENSFDGHAQLKDAEAYITKRLNKSDLDRVGLKPKDLCFIPERVALALQADGWWVRSKPPWIKANAMPESVRDRPTTAHENWYQLGKSATYYYDQDAVLELHRMKPQRRLVQRQSRRDEAMRADKKYLYKLRDEPGIEGNPAGRQRRTTDFWNESLDELITHYRTYAAHLEHIRDNGGMLLDENGQPLGLMYSTKPYKGAHFATFSPDLITPLIKSSISERGCCPRCGKGWRRVVEKRDVNARNEVIQTRSANSFADGTGHSENSASDRLRHLDGKNYIHARGNTIAWRPTCTCYPPPARGPVPCARCGGSGRERGLPADLGKQGNVGNPTYTGFNARYFGKTIETDESCKACSGTGIMTGDVWPDDVDEWEVVPSVVLDPFAGTATVGQALASLQTGGRYPATFVGVDLKHDYLADLARERLGLRALAQWEQGRDGGNGREGLEELPLFAQSNQLR